MTPELKIAIIGDFDPAARTHPATNDALRHAAAHIKREISISWIPTAAIGGDGSSPLEGFSGIVCSPGGRCRSIEGALAGIRFARERGVPFAGT